MQGQYFCKKIFQKTCKTLLQKVQAATYDWYISHTHPPADVRHIFYGRTQYNNIQLSCHSCYSHTLATYQQIVLLL